MFIEFLIMIVRHQPAMGRFHHTIKAVIVRTFRYCRQFCHTAVKNEPAQPALNVQISIADEEIILRVFRGMVDIGKNTLSIDFRPFDRRSAIEVFCRDTNAPFLLVPETFAIVKVFSKETAARNRLRVVEYSFIRSHLRLHTDNAARVSGFILYTCTIDPYVWSRKNFQGFDRIQWGIELCKYARYIIYIEIRTICTKTAEEKVAMQNRSRLTNRWRIGEKRIHRFIRTGECFHSFFGKVHLRKWDVQRIFSTQKTCLRFGIDEIARQDFTFLISVTNDNDFSELRHRRFFCKDSTPP